MKDIFCNLSISYKNIIKLLPVLFLMISSTALFCYLIFFTLLVKLDFDNLVFRKIASVFPVPVIISKNGVIEYYRYKDIQRDFYENSRSLSISDFKVFLIKKMIISDLALKYSIDVRNFSDQEIFVEIEKRVIFDNNINQVAISRIRKISQLVHGGDEFMKIASRYGDAQGLISIDTGSENKFDDFKTDLPALKEGEISRIEYAQDGYYVFQSVGINEKKSDFNYVYIKAKTLDEHIKDEIVLYRLWSFVD